MSLLSLAHESLARGVYHPAMGAARLARRSQRAAYAAYRDSLEFRELSADWGEDRRTAWQLTELRGMVRHAYESTDFYRERLDVAGFDPYAEFDFDDYARLPILEREEVREAGERLISRTVPHHHLREDSTGGSTGTPTRLWKGPVERGWSEAGSEYFMRQVGLPPGSRMAYLWGHHLDPTARSGWRDRLQDHLNASRWYDCFRLEQERLLSYHADLQRWHPRGMIAYANALGALAEAVDGTRSIPDYPRQGFVTGAEKLHLHHREVIERVFRRPVHERYGSRDAGLIGFQVTPRTTLDFMVDWAKVLVEPDTLPDQDGGVAGVLVTKLRADGMPMLRYRVGDLARFPDGSRPGLPTFTLHEVLGRDMDRVWLDGGRWMHPAVVPHLMKDFPVRDFQLHQNPDYSVRVRITPTDGYGDGAEAAILATLRDNLPGLPITIAIVDRIERTKANKWRPVTSDAAPSTPGKDSSA